MNNAGEAILTACKTLVATAQKAEKSNQSLGGKNFYAQKFHQQVLPLHKLETALVAVLESAKIEDAGIKKALADIGIIKSTSKQGRKRTDAMRALEAFIHGPAADAFSDKETPPAPSSEPVLSKSVVIPAKRNYLIAVVLQANQCYESRCYDACAVMIRKLVEILIIEVYEAHKRESEIKGKDGNFYMLGPLVDAILNAPHWNLARESKSTLPKAKDLGNNSAHGRRYVANMADVDKVIPGLRVLVDDLLHIARLK